MYILPPTQVKDQWTFTDRWGGRLRMGVVEVRWGGGGGRRWVGGGGWTVGGEVRWWGV